MPNDTKRPAFGATGWHGERGVARPAMQVLRDGGGNDWYLWVRQTGTLAFKDAPTAETAGFNWETGGNELSLRETIDGTAAFPARTYSLDNDTGSFRVAANNEGFSAAGVLRWDYNTTRLKLSASYELHADANVLIQTNKLNAVHLTIASQAIGDLLYANAATTFARLPIAAAGQVLVSGATPAWSASPTLSEIKVGDGAAATPSYSFTNFPTTGGYATAGPQYRISIAGVARVAFDGAATYLLHDAASIQLGAGSDVLLFRDAPSIFAQRNGLNAQVSRTFNRYASAVDNEYFGVDWQAVANTALVGTRTAATGTARSLRLISQAGNAADSYATIVLSTALPLFRFGYFNAALVKITDATAATFFQIGEFTSSATSGTVVNTAITPTYNQVASTAANTDFLINRTEIAVGSGAQRLVDFQVGGVSKFSVTPAGNTAIAGTLAVTGSVAAGTYNGQTISATASFTGTLTAADNIGMVAAKKLFLDGVAMTGDTYIQESAANVLSLFSGAVEVKMTSGIVTATSQPRAKAYKSGTAQSLANATFTAVTLDAESYDVGALHDNVTNNTRLTVPTSGDGLYGVTSVITFAGNATGVRTLELRKNGVAFAAVQYPAMADTQQLIIASDVPLVATDYVEVWAFQSSGGALNVNTGETSTWLQMKKVW